MEKFDFSSKEKVSVIIPAFQEEKLIAKTLSQFTNEIKQDFNVEVIVSDGGSTDSTVAIAQHYTEYVVLNRDGLRQNISKGRNLGTKAASGEIFIFLNADTLIENPQMFFKIMVETINKRDVVAATCNVHIYPDEQTFTDRVYHKFFNIYFWLLNLFGMGMGRGECHVIKREIFNKVGGYNEMIAAGEDYELFLRLRRIGKIAFVKTLNVFESPRRYRKYGYWYITIMWFLNAFSVLFFHRSLHKEWKPLR